MQLLILMYEEKCKRNRQWRFLFCSFNIKLTSESIDISLPKCSYNQIMTDAVYLKLGMPQLLMLVDEFLELQESFRIVEQIYRYHITLKVKIC